MITIRTALAFFVAVALIRPHSATGQHTEIHYLSGTGNDDTIEWEFMVDGGRLAGQWSTIPLPSQWELEGFGTYDYGHASEDTRGKETGFYRHRFSVPEAWRGNAVDIVFEGSMTDTEVRVNGETAGPMHQGGFYRFRYDISDLLDYESENLLEVDVHKHSANASVNRAERHADYWIFGGIFRPVYLEAKPERHIERTALDARADGSFAVDVYLDGIDGRTDVDVQVTGRILTPADELVGEPFAQPIAAGTDSVRMNTHIRNPKTWSAEYPHRYRVVLALEEEGRPVHEVEESFGFRTVEVRPKDGLYLNGSKVRLRGVNRHTFWPESGRTTSRTLSIRDAELIKDMNMNAVRMSHYPPDEHFLDVADSLGLYILDELAGWQDEYDTDVGRKLVRELVIRDVNHPSVILWNNGNEGGFNFELEDDYARWDPQNRTVLHPWLNDNGISTTHYLPWGCCADYFFGGDDLIMPTEFLHGLYDGGHGAGLNDWWDLLLGHPLGVGGFLWVFADEAVVRTDRDGILDTDGNHAPDGIVGPYREKEGSFFAIKEIWSPVYFEWSELDRLPATFDGRLRIENRYDFTNLKDVAFSWKLIDFAGPKSDTSSHVTARRGAAKAPDVAPRRSGTLTLNLPGDWRNHDALFLTAEDPHGREIYTWTWMIAAPREIQARIVRPGPGRVTEEESGDSIILRAGDASAHFDRQSGRLVALSRDGRSVSLSGPRMIGASGGLQELDHHAQGDEYVIEATYDGELKRVRWRMLPSGWLKLEYAYDKSFGRHDYLGVTFDYAEEDVRDLTWLGRGPYRVWKNRLKGAEFDVHRKGYNDTVTGAEWEGYPEFKGFHADLYWAVLGGAAAAEFGGGTSGGAGTDRNGVIDINGGADLTIVTATDNLFLRLFTPRFPEDARHAQVEFPEGDLSFLHAIPPIGTKFLPAHDHGPEGSPSVAFRRDGMYEATVYFYYGGE